MISTVFHISDLHLPNNFEDRPYNEMIELFLAELYKKTSKLDKDEFRIVLAGDIFQQKIKASNESKEMFHNMLNFLNAMGKTIVIAGNHDLLMNNKSKMDSISPTFAIKGVFENVMYLDKQLDYKSGVIVDDNVIWCLYSIFDDYRKPEKMIELREMYPEHKIIGLYHGNLNGAVTDIGRSMTDGIGYDNFEQCDCVMAGHIHKYQMLKHKGIPLVYSGSLFQQNSGENISKHGYVIWNLEDMSHKHVEVTNKHRILKFRINSYDDVSNDDEQLMNL